MDYLNRINYAETLVDVIDNMIEFHYEQHVTAPRYLLIGRDKLLEFGEVLFDRMLKFKKEEFKNSAEFYAYLLNNTSDTYKGLDIIVVENDRNMLEVA